MATTTETAVYTWLKKRGTVIEYWFSGDRWYWHKKVNGRIVADGSYQHKSSVRRALRNAFGESDG